MSNFFSPNITHVFVKVECSCEYNFLIQSLLVQRTDEGRFSFHSRKRSLMKKLYPELTRVQCVVGECGRKGTDYTLSKMWDAGKHYTLSNSPRSSFRSTGVNIASHIRRTEQKSNEMWNTRTDIDWKERQANPNGSTPRSELMQQSWPE